MTFRAQDILLFLEDQRIKKKYNQLAFCRGIISERNYRRYLNDEVQAKFEIILQLIHRLGFTYSAFMEALVTQKDTLHVMFQTLDQFFKDFNYVKAKATIYDIKQFSQVLTPSQKDRLSLYEKLIRLYERIEDFKDPKDQHTAVQILEDTQLISMLHHTQYTYDEFMFINLIMNKIYNLLPLDTQLKFQLFYQQFIDGTFSIIDGDALEHIQQIYSYYASSIYGKGYISEEETKQGGVLIKDGIHHTRLTHMIYNLMALNYLNSSMCYLHQELEDAKKSAYTTFVAVFSHQNHKGFIPAFKTAFSQVIPIDILKTHLIDEFKRYANNDIFYYEEVKAYNDLSTFYNENH